MREMTAMDDAKNKLIIDNIPLAYYMVHKYYPTFSKDDDIIQAALLGLTKASEKFDERKGKFSTYAGVIIRNEIARELKRRLKEQANISLDMLLEGEQI